MLVFALLHRGSIARSALNAYVRGVPCYADVNARFVGEPLETLGDKIALELVQAGALHIEDDALVPAMVA
jgi:hypothetical protein